VKDTLAATNQLTVASRVTGIRSSTIAILLLNQL